jgi:glycosyltransferase involved in cell wall biosynthesis
MHIGIDARLTYYRTGGISTYIRRLIPALEAMDADNCYTVLHSRKAQQSLVERFRRADLWTPCHHRLERWALSVELTRFNLDLLHSPDFIPPLRGAKRHIITVHDLTFLHYPQFLTAESRRYYNDQIETAVRQADHILSDSDSTRRDLIAMLNVPPEKITVHLLGVDESFAPLSPEALAHFQRELDLPRGYILFVGTFEPRKNIGGLLEAYRLLHERLPDAPPLVLAGNRGWLFDETMAQIDSLKLPIIWRENLSQNAMPALYNLASVLVLPSFYEGFGFPSLEAMACGTVPIVSKRSSLPEVVGTVGLQIDPDDPAAWAAALEKVLTDGEWYAAQRLAGLERAATFTWAQTARIALSVYRAHSG